MGEKAGVKLKALRNAKKMTLKELGEETGFSVSYLSQVERGVSSVTINSLGRIARALNVPTDYFFNPPAVHEDAVMRSYEQSVFTADSSKFYYSRLSNDTVKERILEPEVVNILPLREGETMGPACHAGEEFVYVLEGIMTLCLGKEQILLNPGDSAHYISATPHEWVNRTTRMVRILAVSTRPFFNKSE